MFFYLKDCIATTLVEAMVASGPRIYKVEGCEHAVSGSTFPFFLNLEIHLLSGSAPATALVLYASVLPADDRHISF